MAKLTGASETYFCRLREHETGMTFLNYLNGLRIEQACQLLKDTNGAQLLFVIELALMITRILADSLEKILECHPPVIEIKIIN